MKTIRLFSFAIALLSTSSALFAQLKVGTNPTTIETNSNLEVEASTAGRKVKIDKISGQLTIADGTQGAEKILTSDADGGAICQTAVVPKLRALIQGFDGSGDVDQTLTFAGVDYNDIAGASVDVSSGMITLPTGTYRVIANISTEFLSGISTSLTMIRLAVNGSTYRHFGSSSYVGTGYPATAGGNAIFKLAAPGQVNVAGGALTTGGFTGFPGVGFKVLTGGQYSALTVEKIQ